RGVERPEEERLPALGRGLNGGRVVRVRPAVPREADEVQDRGRGEEPEQCRANPGCLAGATACAALGPRARDDLSERAPGVDPAAVRRARNTQRRRSRKRSAVASRFAAVSTASSTGRGAPGASAWSATSDEAVRPSASANTSIPWSWWRTTFARPRIANV